MELGQGCYSSPPHLVPMLGTDIRQRWIFDDPAVQELHDVESCADNSIVLAQAKRLGNRDICFLEGMQNSILSFDFMCGFRKQLARRLLA